VIGEMTPNIAVASAIRLALISPASRLPIPSNKTADDHQASHPDKPGALSVHQVASFAKSRCGLGVNLASSLAAAPIVGLLAGRELG
jgi:hypothetical protein